MKYYKSITAAAIIAVSGAMTATEADALSLSGTFGMEIYNYDAGGTRANAAATQNNIDTFGGTPTSITYTGALDFGITGTGSSATTTIADFLSSGSAGAGGFDPVELGATGGLLLSSGGGTGDSGATASFGTTTLFKITFESFADVNIDDLSKILSIRHDDGINITDGTSTVGNTTEGIFGGPTNIITTDVIPSLSASALASDFSLIYAAANGDPSVLQVGVVPLPAAAWLLMFASGGLIAAKRRQARRAV